MKDDAVDARVQLPATVLRAAFARARIGFSVVELVDPADPETWVIRANNAAASLNSQVDLADVVGQRFLEAFPAIRGTPFIDWYRTVHASGDAMELPEITYGDAQVPDAAFRVWLEPLPERCVLGQYVNVTLQRRAEGELRALNASLEAKVTARTAELRASQRVLREATYAVAHDLQTPLRHILMLTDPADLDHGPDALSLVHDAARTIRARLAGLMDFTQALRPEPTEPVDVAAEVKAAVQRLGERPAGLTLSVADIPRIAVARGALRMALDELLANGLRFVAAGQSPVIELTMRREGEALVLSVRDEGLGIDPAHHDAIFQAFYRVHGAAEFPGLGLGLARTRVAVEAAGGSVSVTSARGRGATFTVRLPIAADAPAV